MNSRSRWLVAVVVLLIATFAARWLDMWRTVGDVKGDESTYIAMAESIAHDFDIRYEQRDIDRFMAIYPEGPKGIFLKRAFTRGLPVRWTGGPALTKYPVPETRSLAFGKPFIYPLAAAPFVAIGGVGGMLVFNVALLALCLWCALRFAWTRAGRIGGTIVALGFVLCSAIPVYAVLLTSDLFNVAVVFLAMFLWLYKCVASKDAAGWLMCRGSDWAAAVLLGLVTFSKPNHVLLIVPMVLCLAVWRRWRQAVVVGVIFVATTAGLYGANALLSGEANYQGAATADGRDDPHGRMVFYPELGFPFWHGATFVDAGHAMVTNDTSSERTETADIFRHLLAPNLKYFVVGRNAGLVPFAFPGLVVAAMWLWRWRRIRLWQAALFATCLAMMAALFVVAPYSWNGGGGPIGNRYFLSTYPLLLFLLPSGAGWLGGVAAAVVGATFVGPVLLHPFQAAKAPWTKVESGPFKLLPVELTLLNDLPVFVAGPGRGRIPYLDDPTLILAYPDEETYGAEPDPTNPDVPLGQWIAGPASTDIVLRTEFPIVRLVLRFETQRAPNHVTVAIGGRRTALDLPADGRATTSIAPGLGVWFHGAYNYDLHLTTSDGFVATERNARGEIVHRPLGVFMRPPCLRLTQGTGDGSAAPCQVGHSPRH